MLTVDCNGHRCSCRRNGPTGFDRKSGRVDDGHIAFLFIVVVQQAFTISHALFHRTAHVDDFHYSFLGRVYNSGIGAVAVKGKNKLGGRVVDNRVGILGAFDFVRDLKVFKIEHGHVSAVAIGDKSFAKLRKHDHTMAALQAGNGAHQREVIGVDHFNLSTVRQINAPPGWIHGDVIEIFAATRCRAQRYLLNEAITRTWRAGHYNRANQSKENKRQRQQ